MVAKDPATTILGGKRSFIVRTLGSLKRAGGLGDLLTGAIATYAHWDYDFGPPLASEMIRLASAKGYRAYGRSMTAPDVLAKIPETIREIDPEAFLEN